MAFGFLVGVSLTSSPLRFLGVAGVVVPPSPCQLLSFRTQLSQTLHTSLSGSNGLKCLAVVNALLELFRLGYDRAELVFEAAGSASPIKSGHYVQLLFGDTGTTECHQQDGDAVRWDHLLITGGSLGGFDHVVDGCGDWF